MKTSFSTLACPDWNLSEVLTAAVKYGYDGVELRVISRELDLWKLPEFTSHALATTRKVIEDHGLVVAVADSSACFHSPDASERNRNFESALRMGEIAAGLGAPAIRVFGDRIQPGNTRAQTMEWIADSLHRLVDRLRPNGVQVWLETHGDFAGATQVSELLTLTRSAEVGIIWDPANAFGEFGQLPLIPPQLSSRVRHVHLKDLVREDQRSPRYALAGEGEFPFSTMYKALAEIQFEDFVSFEWEKLWHPELAPPEVALPHFMEWWKRRVIALC